MAGHNKWSSIKHKKAKTDAQRGKIFSKLAREIMMAAKLGGEDTSMNPRLRLAIQNAKSANMPNENVKRAIQKGVGGGDDTNLHEIQYEAYAPFGVAVLINTLTDNVNRTISNIRSIVSKSGGNIAEKGSVSYLFKRSGFFLFDKDTYSDTEIDIAIDHDAGEIDEKMDGSLEIICPLDNFELLKTVFDQQSCLYSIAEVTFVPSILVPVTEIESKKIISLIDLLEEDDDVQDLFVNFEIKNV